MGLSIQNEDVKSKEELAARGATPDRLIHDKKIWVTANDILKPLDQAITDGDIGAEVGVGSAYRHRSIAYGDGSTEELGLQQPPFLDENGNTVLITDYTFLPEDFMRVFVDKQEYIEFISEATTPESYWFREGNNRVIIKGDWTDPSIRLEVQVMDGVDLPPILSSLYAGLDLIGEAWANTDWSGGSAGVTQIYVQDNKTKIEIDTTFTKDDYVFVYINNEYYLPFRLGITTSKYYTLEGNNTIVLDDNYSTQTLPLYIAVFKGKFLQDELGNVCFQIGANLREYSVESPDNTIWGLTATDFGEIVSESGSTQAPDPIRLRRDDDTLVALSIENDGTYFIDDNPSAGIAFDQITLTSPNGTAWVIGVSNDNEIYLDSISVSSNKFCLEDSRGNIIHEVQKTPEGAIFKLQHFNKGELPENPELTTQNTLLAIEQDGSNKSVRLMQYNTFRQEWQSISGGQASPVGEVRSSLLPPNEFKIKYGDDWEIMDGTVVLDVNDHPELALKVTEWVDDDKIYIPDHRDYVMETRTWRQETGNTSNHGVTNVALTPPEGFEIGDHWAGISSISRVYFTGIVDGNDTTFNDYYLRAGEGYAAEVGNSEQRAAGLNQMLQIYRKEKAENRYIKVK
jgi:hypothetical protein